MGRRPSMGNEVSVGVSTVVALLVAAVDGGNSVAVSDEIGEAAWVTEGAGLALTPQALTDSAGSKRRATGIVLKSFILGN